MMTEQELFFENETRKHQQEVARLLMRFASMILERAATHDASKMEDPERAGFIEWTPKLKTAQYGSEEYKGFLKALKPTLDHHYAHNKHHPEFNDINGYSFATLNDPIRSMHLVDIVEMLCDWMAASRRTKDGDIGKSFEINEKRFGIAEQLTQVMRNTSGVLKP